MLPFFHFKRIDWQQGGKSDGEAILGIKGEGRQVFLKTLAIRKTNQAERAYA